MRSWLAVLALVATTRVAAADDAADSAPPADAAPEVSTSRRALAVTAAIVPGLIVRGAGSWVVGERRAARRLATFGYGGLAFGGAAGALIGLSGANPYTTAAVPIVLTGVGAFLTGWIEDIYIAAGGSTLAPRTRQLSTWSVEVGETWQHDAYRERLLQRLAGTATVGRFGATAAALLDTGGDAYLVSGDLRTRVIGDERCADCLVARVGGRVQRDDDDRVTQHVGEVELLGRLGLSRFGRAFGATFVELTSGVGVVRASYAGLATDVDSLLLGRFAWGAYIPGGEITTYYDHRRDGLAGGIDAARASGFIGSFGVNVDVRVAGPWALRGELQIGNTYLTTLAVAYRGGAR